MNGKNHYCTNPAKYVTKPFDNDMETISKYLHQHLLYHQKHLNFDELDLNKAFNSCITLIYAGGDVINK